jgi:hypothetical protein
MGLLACGLNTSEASSKSKLGQLQVQLCERWHRRSRCAELHSRARGGVEHPCLHDDDDAWRRLDVNHLAVGALLAVLAPYATPIQRVPAVKDLNFLRDMRRMTR